MARHAEESAGSKRQLQTSLRPEDSPGLLLWQISNIWQARQRGALKSFDLTHVQFVLLATLAYAPKDTHYTQKQLASYAKTDVMMTSQVVRRLEQKGLVVRNNDACDARAVTVVASRQGVALVNQAVQAVEAIDAEFFRPLGAEVSTFIAMMRDLTHRS